MLCTGISITLKVILILSCVCVCLYMRGYSVLCNGDTTVKKLNGIWSSCDINRRGRFGNKGKGNMFQ